MNKTVEKMLKKPITATLLSILFGFIVAAVILAVAGYHPIEAFSALLNGTVGRPKYIANVLIKGTPIRWDFLILVQRGSILWALLLLQ